MEVKLQGFIKRAAASKNPNQLTPRVYLDVGTIGAGEFSFSVDGFAVTKFDEYMGRVVNIEGTIQGSQFRGDDGKTSQLLRFTRINITEVAPVAPSAVPAGGNGKPVTS